jgi:hypothetical protein
LKVFYSFLIIVVSAILVLLPVQKGVYDFRTTHRIDIVTIVTSNVTDNATVQLFKPIYTNDTSTLTFLSHSVNDAPLFWSYNGTSRALVIIGLAPSVTRSLEIGYDIDTLPSSMNKFCDVLPMIWILIWFAFPILSCVAIWTGRA